MLPWKPEVRSRQISNPSKLSCMLLLPASMKRIRSRTAEKKWRHCFLIISLWGFFRRSRAANSAVGGPIRLKFKLVPASRISNSSKLSCMLSLPASMKRIRLRTAEKKWRRHFSHYKPMGIFSDFQGQLTPQSVVRSSRNSNSSELSCMSSLPASIKRIG